MTFDSGDNSKTCFLARFFLSPEAAIAKLLACCQQDEGTYECATRFCMLAQRAGIRENCYVVHRFVSGLHLELQADVMRKELHSIDEITRICNYWQSCSFEFDYDEPAQYDAVQDSSSGLHDSSEAIWCNGHDHYNTVGISEDTSDYAGDCDSNAYAYD